MKLRRVLRLHDQARHKLGLKNVLGDAFLLNANPVYRRARELAAQKGYRLIPAWETYKRASLFELPTILKKKAIPYNDSVPTLKRLVREYKVDDDMGDVPVNFVSYQFHESAHCLADAGFARIKPRGKQEKILFALLCESFANATESMATTFATGEAHRFFLEQNSYIHASPERIRRRRKALKVWGRANLFRLLWMSYLYSNFLVDEVPRDELEGVLRFALRKETLTKADVELGIALLNDAYELNETFRVKTARLYLRMLGVAGDTRKNLAFDFTGLFLSRARYQEAFEKLIDDLRA